MLTGWWFQTFLCSMVYGIIMNMLLKMTIYSGITQLQNGGSFHSYVSLPEGMLKKINGNGE